MNLNVYTPPQKRVQKPEKKIDFFDFFDFDFERVTMFLCDANDVTLTIIILYSDKVYFLL